MNAVHSRCVFDAGALSQQPHSNTVRHHRPILIQSVVFGQCQGEGKVIGDDKHPGRDYLLPCAAGRSCVCVCVCARARARVCVCERESACVRAGVRVYTHVCVCTNAYIHTYMHAYAPARTSSTVAQRTWLEVTRRKTRDGAAGSMARATTD